MISFDGDQTLYSDGGNFDASNDELALAIIRLLCHGIKVIVITAAGYGYDGSKYEHRLQGLLDRFMDENMSLEHIENFYVFGGECNYLFQCTVKPKVGESTEEGNNPPRARLLPVPITTWQADHLPGPKPYFWDQTQVTELLNIAETSMRDTVSELKLRAKILRKERAIGVYPGGPDMIKTVPIGKRINSTNRPPNQIISEMIQILGHGSKKLKQEALDEVVLRLMEAVRSHQPPIQLPFCVFNGGSDAWLDIGNKSIAVAALQGLFGLDPAQCLHVGDQVSQSIIELIYSPQILSNIRLV